MPGIWPVVHVMKSPRRHEAQCPQWPPCQPTPTRTPTFHSGTSEPTASKTPTTSWPGTRGNRIPGKAPNLVNESLWQIPHACTLIRTSLGLGVGISRSTNSNAPLALETWTARMRDIALLHKLGSRGDASATVVCNEDGLCQDVLFRRRSDHRTARISGHR